MSHWCAICRGEDELFKCGGCTRRFHIECLGMQVRPDKSWRCDDCENPVELDAEEKERAAAFQASQKLLEAQSRRQAMRKRSSLHQQRSLIEPFVERKRLTTLERDVQKEAEALEKIRREELEAVASAHASSSTSASAEAMSVRGNLRACDSTTPSYTTATLREYQVDGVNWMAKGYDGGIGGILGDQMGLGKTLQTLTFLAYLKKVRGSVGPSLVVAPLAVYQNWANECKQWTPVLTFFKVHGSAAERAKIMQRMDVTYGEYDVYVTTYDTLKACEAFFTETIPRWQVRARARHDRGRGRSTAR